LISVVITDGRDEYLKRTLESCWENIPGFAPIIVDDSGLREVPSWLMERWGSYTLIRHSERKGMAAAVRTAWTAAVGRPGEFIWHQEDDFTLNGPVDIQAMAQVLRKHPKLAQLVLKRQPWSDEEIAAGGQMEVSPEDYTDRDGFVEHRKLFSFNPALCRRSAIEDALSDPGDGLERGVTDTLLRHGYYFGYFGARADPPRCEHIGIHRSAGYRW
jgi:glycosyl transferase family 2